jgi:hypothetical protein
MRERGVEYLAVKRRNMIKTEEERFYYWVLNRVRSLV